MNIKIAKSRVEDAIQDLQVENDNSAKICNSVYRMIEKLGYELTDADQEYLDKATDVEQMQYVRDTIIPIIENN